MKVGDEWEALFGIWHERAHNYEVQTLDRDMKLLESRIVKLEAFMAALRSKDPAMIVDVRLARRVAKLEDRLKD